MIWIPGFPHLVDPGLKLTDSEFYYYSNSNGNLNSGQYIFEICPTSLESKHELMEYFIERGWKIRTIAQRNYLSGLVLDNVRKNCKKNYITPREIINNLNKQEDWTMWEIDENLDQGLGIKIVVNRKKFRKFKEDLVDLKELDYKIMWNISNNINKIKVLIA